MNLRCCMVFGVLASTFGVGDSEHPEGYNLVTWGLDNNAGDSARLRQGLAGNVSHFIHSQEALLAVTDSGALLKWGDHNPTSYGIEVANVVDVVGNCALTDDGIVVSLGPNQPYNFNESQWDELLLDVMSLNALFSITPYQAYSFAALKDDGTVITWGFGDGGSVLPPSPLTEELFNITKIYNSFDVFVALRGDGRVHFWDKSGVVSTPAGAESNVVDVFVTNYAFAALKQDGSVVTFGYKWFGADSSGVASQLSSGVTSITSTSFAFAALKDDKSVVIWGDSFASSSVRESLASGVVAVFATAGAFAALKTDGSVVAWGEASHGGDISSVAASLQSGVDHIVAGTASFAAIKDDGSVVTWGYAEYGGDSTAVASQLSEKVVHVVTSQSVTMGRNVNAMSNPNTRDGGLAFAALKSDGAVVTWGRAFHGGDSSSVAAQLQGGVVDITMSSFGGAALKEDGSVVSWPSSVFGTAPSSTTHEFRSSVFNVKASASGFVAFTQENEAAVYGVNMTLPPLADVLDVILSGNDAVAVLHVNGSVSTYSDDPEKDGSSVSTQLSADVISVVSNANMFVATKSDGSVVYWGSNLMNYQPFPHGTYGVIKVLSSNHGFAGLRADGSVVYGGKSSSYEAYRSVAEQLMSGVLEIKTTSNAFAFLKNDGSVVTFGLSKYPLVTDVVELYSTSNGFDFAAVKGDGSLVSWGKDDSGNRAEFVPYDVHATTKSVGIRNLVVNDWALAVLFNDGSVKSWGSALQGGNTTPVATHLESGVVRVVGGFGSFAAVKEDGSVVVWGKAHTANFETEVGPQLAGDVKEVYLGQSAYVAVKTTGDVVAWGEEMCGGQLSDAVLNELQAGTIVSIQSSSCAFAALVAVGDQQLVTHEPTPQPTAHTFTNQAVIPLQYKRLHWGGLYTGPLAEDGSMHGFGVLLYPNGGEYRGDFRNNVKHGDGEYFPATGKVYKYKGKFANGMRNGQGVLYLHNGDRFESNFTNGKAHGTGTYTSANGSQSESEYVHGVKQ